MLPPDKFPGGGPTGLAEFFGDHMVVNGVIWPKMDVEPRNYRLRLLNGCDSRFLAIQFFEVPAGAKDFSWSDPAARLHGDRVGPGSGEQPDDAEHPADGDGLTVRPDRRLLGRRRDRRGANRVIMKNIGGDEPFGGDIPGPRQAFRETDRIMAFDVVLPLNARWPT